MTQPNLTIMPNDITLVGIPFDAYSSHLKGAAQAPAAIKESIRFNTFKAITYYKSFSISFSKRSSVYCRAHSIPSDAIL